MVMTFIELLNIAKNSNNNSRSSLTHNESVNIIINDPDFAKLSPSAAIIIANQIRDWRVWKLIVSRLDCPLNEAMLLCSQVSDPDVWDSLFSRPDINQIPINELIAIAEEIDHYRIWIYILSRRDLPLRDCIKYAKQVDNKAVWNVVIDRIKNEPWDF